jgi:hypothetical protein
MVEFCTLCGTSLPKGDLSFKGGKIFTSHDYNCPSCHQTANPLKDAGSASPEPELDRDLVFKKGSIKAE